MDLFSDKNIMKILMIGLGSVGQRHLRNIRRLYGEQVEINAYRVRGLQRTFSDDMKIREGIELDTEFNIHVFTDLDEALANKPDIVFISNITAKHAECAVKAARAGCDIFLEKPVSDSLEYIDELAQIVKEKGIIVYVGYQNRHHPCISDICKAIEKENIGRIISVHSEFSERISTMHTYEDYKDTYMARKNMGGGPILNLQIHCLDYLQMLFGTPVSVSAVGGNSGIAGLDVEDHVASVYCFKENDGRSIPVYAYTDFYQYPPVHTLKVVCENGRIEADFNKAETRIIQENSEKKIEHSDFVRNDMFIAELEEFVDCVANKKKTASDLEQGIVGLKMALSAKKSVANGGRREQIC